MINIGVFCRENRILTSHLGILDHHQDTRKVCNLQDLVSRWLVGGPYDIEDKTTEMVQPTSRSGSESPKGS